MKHILLLGKDSFSPQCTRGKPCWAVVFQKGNQTCRRASEDHEAHRLAHVRHSFATLLKANGEDVKVVQESLRHANSRITLDVYTQGLMPTRRMAQGRVVKSLLAPCGHAHHVRCCKCLKHNVGA